MNLADRLEAARGRLVVQDPASERPAQAAPVRPLPVPPPAPPTDALARLKDRVG
jgi:pilus assembly protein CpaF